MSRSVRSIPARAGETRLGAGVEHAQAVGPSPRVRGKHLLGAIICPSLSAGPSPRVRGKPRPVSTPTCDAYRGPSPRVRGKPCSVIAVPLRGPSRVRGKRSVRLMQRFSCGPSPRVRGKLSVSVGASAWCNAVHPRACGGNRAWLRGMDNIEDGPSPRVRGKRRSCSPCPDSSTGPSPRVRGKLPAASLIIRGPMRVHPRACGGNHPFLRPHRPFHRPARAGPSPRVRGKRRSIPASAGETCSRRRLRFGPSPRVRGKHAWSRIAA